MGFNGFPIDAVAEAAYRVPEHYDPRELPRAGVLLIGDQNFLPKHPGDADVSCWVRRKLSQKVSRFRLVNSHCPSEGPLVSSITIHV